MKTKVICLVGASGTGKTTIAKELDKLDNINVIQSYTTRPPRSENEWGHTFIDEGGIAGWVGDVFKTVDWLDAIGVEIEFHKKEMIAYFNSYNSRHHYFATDEQVIRGKTNIYVVDPNGAEQVKEYYKKHNKQELVKQGMKYHEEYKRDDVEVITIAIHEDESVRRKRIMDRKIPTISQLRSGKTYIYQEALKEASSRIDRDKELFKVVKCDYSIKGSSNALEFIKKELL